MSFKTERITVNEVTPVLLAKGPCRCRLEMALGGGVFCVGELGVTALTGYRANAVPELHLSPGERVFGISDTGAGTFDVMVMTYGVP